MKILKVATCGGCGKSQFEDEYDEMGWCEVALVIVNRYTLPDWCPLEDAYCDCRPAVTVIKQENAKPILRCTCGSKKVPRIVAPIKAIVCVDCGLRK